MKFCEVMGYYDYKISNIVKKLNVARESVNSWKKNDFIPFKMQCLIEVDTNGKLKANKDDK
jgi:hypothetical protein